MSRITPAQDEPIIIVGAGIFGLSSALHLAQRGYTNITVFDKQPYHQSFYCYDNGCDGASSDVNKIIRAAYGPQSEYQNMAFDAIQHWNRWNAEIKSGQDLPAGMTPDDVLFTNNGNISMTDQPGLSAFEQATRESMLEVGRGDTQIVLEDPKDVARARSQGFGHAVNPFERKDNYGTLDTSAGVVYADKACRFALHKIKQLGVRTIFGAKNGSFVTFLEDGGRTSGIRTADERKHYAALTIMACGGWTPGLMPQLDGLCETTSGSVVTFQIPKTSELWNRLAPGCFPVWTYKMHDGEGGGLYGFPRDENGVVKIGYRGLKYTNPQIQDDGRVRSVPVTRWTPVSTRQLPLAAAQRIKRVLKQFIPELLPYHTKTRLCWYTDTFDNHFVIDFVPNKPGLMVVTGGSGHGFKFLPTIGRYVVDRIEGFDTRELNMWRWRMREDDELPYNNIMQGLQSRLALANQPLTVEDSLDGEVARL